MVDVVNVIRENLKLTLRSALMGDCTEYRSIPQHKLLVEVEMLALKTGRLNERTQRTPANKDRTVSSPGEMVDKLRRGQVAAACQSGEKEVVAFRLRSQ